MIGKMVNYRVYLGGFVKYKDWSEKLIGVQKSEQIKVNDQVGK